MGGEAPRWRTREFAVFLIVFVISLMSLFLNALLLKRHWPKQLAWWSVFGDLLSAILTASLIGIGQIVLRVYVYRKQQQPFQEFWGQEYGGPSGRIILQSDHLHDLTDQLTAELCTNLAAALTPSSTVPSDFSAKLGSLLESQVEDESGRPKYIYGKQRVFKARTWLNRCDVEGARNIREAFSDLGFKPPDFVTCERPANSDHQTHSPFEIYMGLGFTADIKLHVNDSCKGFLSIEETDKGDAICILDRIAGNALKELRPVRLVSNEPGKLEEEGPYSLFYPKNWDLHSFAQSCQEQSGLTVNDYAYILRDIRISNEPHSGGKQVVFHVAGFTESGTWAAGHYLRHHWKKLYTDHVKESKHGGRFVILLKGESPFNELRTGTPPWKEVEVIKHNQRHPNALNRDWDTELSELISERGRKQIPHH